MATLRCTACSMNVQVTEPDGARCPNCDGPLAASEATAAEGARPALVLTHQRTGARIGIDAATTELGRESFGAEVLGTIPQVSRKHCRLDFRGDSYFVSDLGSMHGTFAEVAGERRSCAGAAVGLGQGTRLWLGQEEFLVRLQSPGPGGAREEHAPAPAPRPPEAPAKRYCPDCGCEVEPSAVTCPQSHFLGG